MKRTLINITLAIVAIAALAFIACSVATAEIGWPVNEAGEPTDGGNWQGTGQEDIPEPINQKAEWYNETKNDTAWIIEDGDDVLRSYSAFDYKYDLTVQSGGILRLDSVRFHVNDTADRSIVIEDGGQLHLTNGTISGYEIYVAPGGELHVTGGNGTAAIVLGPEGAPGLIIPDGAVLELVNAQVSGSTTLLTLSEADAEIHETWFSTSGTDEACILLNAPAEIFNNTFTEGSQTGTYAIIADVGIDSKIYNNTFDSFKYGFGEYGRAIVSYGPIEIYDNYFTGMKASNKLTASPYIIYFVGVEPTDHGGEPVWQTNHFKGRSSTVGDERVNIFKQAYYVDVEVLNLVTDNPIKDVEVSAFDVDDAEIGPFMTDEEGMVYYELPSFILSTNDDGNDGDYEPKNIIEKSPYDFEASKDGESANLEDEDIDANTGFTLYLDLVEFDYGVSGIDLPVLINAGDEIQIDATVFNDGYNRDTSVIVEFYIQDSTRGEVLLGTVEVPVDLDFVHAYLTEVIDMGYAGQLVTFMAKTTFRNDWDDDSNNEFTTGSITINEKPVVNIATPGAGETLGGIINITGTADDNNLVDSVTINISGVLAWVEAIGTDAWYYELDSKTLGLTNGDYVIEVRAQDDDGAYSDIVMITVTIVNTPTISINNPDDGSLLLGDATITMVGESTKLDANIARVYIVIDDGPEINASTTGDWSQWQVALKSNTVDRINPLSDGEHTITAWVEDDDGLKGSVTYTYTVYSLDEATNPVVTITTDPFSANQDKWVEGTVTDDFSVLDIQYRINEGSWKAATETFDLFTTEATFRIRVQPGDKDIDEGNNLLQVRAYDNDGNSTGQLPFTKPLTGLVDLTITGVTLKDENGGTLEAGDLNVGKQIKVVVSVGVAMTGSDTISVSIRIDIGSITGSLITQDNVTSNFDKTIGITLTAAMEGQDSYTIKLDPTNVLDEFNDNDPMDAEDNNILTDTFPGPIGSKEDDDPDDEESFIPGFEVVSLIAVLAVAGFLGYSKKRRE